MKKAKSYLLTVSALITLCIWGFIAVYKGGYAPRGLHVAIFMLIMIIGIYKLMINTKKHKAIEEGFPAEDEMSNRIEYQAGYYAFNTSMYIWLFIFFFKDLFPDIESMLVGGILSSVAVFIGIKHYLERNFHEHE